MIDPAQSLPIEELLFAIQTLTEHNQELLDDNKAQAEANTEQTKQTADMIKQLTDLLKVYQDKEVLIIDNTNTAFKDNLNTVFEQNRVSYHDAINKGFTTHIDTATKTLSTVAIKIEKQFEDLETVANNSKTEFESRHKVFKLYENTYDIQSRQLKKSVSDALTDVLSDTKDKLDGLGDDFSEDLTKRLSWKITAAFSAICLSIMLLTFGTAWLYIPSKSAIAERKAAYDNLAAAQLLSKTTLSNNVYYARVDTASCVKGTNPLQTWCKFK